MSLNASSMRSSRGGAPEKSGRDGGGFTKGFYGILPKKMGGGFSLLKKKSKQVPLESDCRPACKSMDQYKEAADKLHYSLLFMLVESTTAANSMASNKMPVKVPVDAGYQHFSDFMTFYEKTQKHGKINVEPLEPVARAAKRLHEEQEKYVKKQWENLKPLTKFIGEEYWEYAKLKSLYQVALEKCELAQQNKVKSAPDAEKAEQAAQRSKEDAKTKMMGMLVKVNGYKDGHIKCLSKFWKATTEWHKSAASILVPFDIKDPEEQSKSTAMSSENTAK
ncbi:unnamed protein product [Caenorhabditis sp. 36 PRJEB53466]|nr:unnamed protein product [Caenorhabditis sp. 36 PRJEB53466]